MIYTVVAATGQLSWTVAAAPANIPLQEGFPISTLEWDFVAAGSFFRVLIRDRVTANTLVTFSNDPDADDKNNTCNGQTAIASILAEIKSAFNVSGGAGGGDATAANQQTQIDQSGEIIDNQSLQLLQVDSVIWSELDPSNNPNGAVQIIGFDYRSGVPAKLPVSPDSSGSFAYIPIMANPVSKYRSTTLGAAKQEVIGAQCVLFGYNFYNPNATVVFIKFYQQNASQVIVGTTVPFLTISLPALSTTYVQPNVMPIATTQSGLTIACVTGSADNSVAAPTIAVFAHIYYRPGLF